MVRTCHLYVVHVFDKTSSNAVCTRQLSNLCDETARDEHQASRFRPKYQLSLFVTTTTTTHRSKCAVPANDTKSHASSDHRQHPISPSFDCLGNHTTFIVPWMSSGWEGREREREREMGRSDVDARVPSASLTRQTMLLWGVKGHIGQSAARHGWDRDIPPFGVSRCCKY